MGHKDDIIKQLKKRIAQLEKSAGTEDKTGLLEDPANPYKYKDWAPLAEVVASVDKVLELRKAGKWSWAYNWASKYVDIRVDMRDGHAILRNDEQGRISVAQLEYQYNQDEDHMEELAKAQSPIEGAGRITWNDHE